LGKAVTGKFSNMDPFDKNPAALYYWSVIALPIAACLQEALSNQL
jgi:hypothetical protein